MTWPEGMDKTKCVRGRTQDPDRQWITGLNAAQGMCRRVLKRPLSGGSPQQDRAVPGSIPIVEVAITVLLEAEGFEEG